MIPTAERPLMSTGYDPATPGSAPLPPAGSASMTSGARDERCAECGAPMASDQRYCVECGERRGEQRFPAAGSGQAPSGAGASLHRR